MLESASEKGSRRSSSDLSVWSDTGDLAEQLAHEDPLATQLRESVDRELLGRRYRTHPKRVHYSRELDDDVSSSPFDLEKIPIPTPPPRQISRVERVLAAIMSPRGGRSGQIHGLVGKPLL